MIYREKFPNLCRTLSRHKGIGNITLIIISLYVLWQVIWPKAFDIASGEPNITTSIVVNYEPEKGMFIQDYTHSDYYVSGSRLNRVYDEFGITRCSKDWTRAWENNVYKQFSFNAFAGCSFDIPDFKFKICSEFTVRSTGGRERLIGSADYCTPLLNPKDIINGT